MYDDCWQLVLSIDGKRISNIILVITILNTKSTYKLNKLVSFKN